MKKLGGREGWRNQEEKGMSEEMRMFWIFRMGWKRTDCWMYGWKSERGMVESVVVSVSEAAVACLIPCQASEARGFAAACIYNLREAITSLFLSSSSDCLSPQVFNSKPEITRMAIRTKTIKNATRSSVTCICF